MSRGTRRFARHHGLPPARNERVEVQRSLYMTMRDGVDLVADRYLPAGTPAAPVVLLRTPYGRKQDRLVARLFAERGYQVMLQSCRGTFGSGGTWRPFLDETADGADTVAWLREQPWFTGDLFVYGQSYVGMTAWATLTHRDNGVRAAAIGVSTSNPRTGMVYPGGALSLQGMLAWATILRDQERPLPLLLWTALRLKRALGRVVDVLPLNDIDTLGTMAGPFHDWLEHADPDDPWWGPAEYGADLDRLPPLTLVGGWHDPFLAATVNDFVRACDAGADVRLRIGPWVHAAKAGTAHTVSEALRLFDATLAGTPPSDEPVQAQVRPGEPWHRWPTWPPPSQEVCLNLHPGGTLAERTPDPGTPDTYAYDPADPTPSLGFLNLTRHRPADQREREQRSDVLCYTSAPLLDDLELIGEPLAELEVASELAHVDFDLRLCAVDHRDRSTPLTEGYVRLRPGTVARRPDGTFSLSVVLAPLARTVPSGTRLRLQVASGAHPAYARNLGTGEPVGNATILRRSRQTIYSEPGRMSRLVLPTIGSNRLQEV